MSESGSDSETLFLAPTAQLQAFIRDHEAEIFDKNEGVMRRGQ